MLILRWRENPIGFTVVEIMYKKKKMYFFIKIYELFNSDVVKKKKTIYNIMYRKS